MQGFDIFPSSSLHEKYCTEYFNASIPYKKECTGIEYYM
jgi:hypothetical protein